MTVLKRKYLVDAGTDALMDVLDVAQHEHYIVPHNEVRRFLQSRM